MYSLRKSPVGPHYVVAYKPRLWVEIKDAISQYGCYSVVDGETE